MKKNLFFLLLLQVFTGQISAQTVALGFTAPDTVCVNQTFTIQNTSVGNISTNHWSFCIGNTNGVPTATNLSNPANQLYYPVYYSIAKQGSNYYAFVCNNATWELVRLSYGNSLLNTPTVTNLGNLGIMLSGLEDLHLEYENGNWYGIMVGGSLSGTICRLSFGASLANTPTAVNMGNIGNLSYPQRLQIFWSGGNCYGFTPNRNGSTLTRFDFGNSITNTPTGLNLGNIGSFNTCDDISIINYNGNWYGYVVNEDDNSITRLDFGNSLLNIPTGVNLGNTGALDGPRGIDVFVECGEIRGLIVNRFSDDLLKMNFTAGPTGPIITTTYGNIGNFSFPHSIERFRVGNTLYAMIPNVNNATLTRIEYPGCTSASPASSSLQNPPSITYNTPGTYYMNYIVNEGTISQSSLCKKIEVINGPVLSAPSKTICRGQSTVLSVTGAQSYSWSTNQTTSMIQVAPLVSTIYTVQGWNGSSCKSNLTVPVTVLICEGLEEYSAGSAFVISPNPAKDQIEIQTETKAEKLKIQILDCTGKLIYSGRHTSDSPIDVSWLRPAMYFLTIESIDHQLVHKKFIKE